jgi:hypothetical protein
LAPEGSRAVIVWSAARGRVRLRSSTLQPAALRPKIQRRVFRRSFRRRG